MEQTPDLSTESRTHSRRGGQARQDMLNMYNDAVRRSTDLPPYYAVEQPANHYYGNSLTWTQPLTHHGNLAFDVSGSHGYLNDGFLHTGAQDESAPAKSVDFEDTYVPHSDIAAGQNRGVLLPPSSSCDSLTATRSSAAAETDDFQRPDTLGFWLDPSLSALPPVPHAGGHQEAIENFDDDALEADLDTKSSAIPHRVTATGLVHRSLGAVQQKNPTSQKARRKSSLRTDSASSKQRAAGRQSREQVPSETWDMYKPAIRELYLEERKPLKDVIRIMNERHGFLATPKMYKTRFTQWGFAKNNTEDEVKRLLSMKFERDAEGKVSEFVRNGKVVNLGTYLKRKGVTEYDLVDFESKPQLPSHVLCRTPSPPPAPGYLRSPDLIRAQEILVGNMRKALIHCQQTEASNPYQQGWTSLLLWGAGSSSLLYEAGKLFEKSQNDRAAALLMRGFQQLEVDLGQLSTQGTKELLFCMSHRNPGMMTALSKYLAAYATKNYARMHPLRLIFTNLYEIQQKHGPAALSDLVWSAMPTLAEAIEHIHGAHSPLAVRTWIDLAMLYNHTNPYRLSNLFTELGQMNYQYSGVKEEDMGFRYARLQLAASMDASGITHRAQLVDVWNFSVSHGLVYGVRGQPDVYCWHPILQVRPMVTRMLQRYLVTMKHVEHLFRCKMICGFPGEPHATEHADETEPPEHHRLLRVPITLSDLEPVA